MIHTSARFLAGNDASPLPIVSFNWVKSAERQLQAEVAKGADFIMFPFLWSFVLYYYVFERVKEAGVLIKGDLVRGLTNQKN